MKAKTIILTLVLFILIVAGMYIYTRIKKTEHLTEVKTAIHTLASLDMHVVS